VGAHKGAAVGGGGGDGGGRSLIAEGEEGEGPARKRAEERESGERERGARDGNPRGKNRAETNGPLHVPRKREIKHCATVFHPGASAKREASLGRDHAPVCRRLAGPCCTKRRC